jgi:hypothetical protein
MEIPNSFPCEMTNDEIKDIISKCEKIVTNVTKPGSNISLGASYYVSMIELAQTELNKRIQANLLDLIENQNRTNRKTSIINWVLSGLTIILAFLTIYIGTESLRFNKSDKDSNEVWQKEQIELLRNQNEELQHINRLLLQKSETDSIIKKTSHNTRLSSLAS